jgi:hypothetical protein
MKTFASRLRTVVLTAAVMLVGAAAVHATELDYENVACPAKLLVKDQDGRVYKACVLTGTAEGGYCLYYCSYV